MNTKKILSIITCGLIITSMLAGCARAPAAPKAVHLKLYLGQGQARFKAQYTKFIDQWTVAYLKGKNVKVTYEMEMPDSTTDEQLLKTRLAAGDEMDIFTVHAQNDISVYAKAGYMEDLSDQPYVSKLLPIIKDAVSYQGKVVGMPLETSLWGYIYNKKIFADNKITPPTTLTEMKAVDAKLKAANITPWLLAYKESWIPQLVNSLAVGATVQTTDKEFLNDMNKGTGSYSSIPGMFDIMDEINANGTPKPLDIGNDQGSADFANGKAAMWLQGPWNSDAILKANKDFQLGVAALPISDNPNQTMVDLGVTTTLAISKTSKNKDVAKSLLAYFLDDATSSEFYNSCGFAPVATNQSIKVSTWVNDAEAYVKAGKSYLDAPMPQAVKDEVGKQLQGYYLKSLTKASIIKDLDKTWADSLKK
jgi:raffinose/stachyose/melibiose transport system substrate-binding protein